MAKLTKKQIEKLKESSIKRFFLGIFLMLIASTSEFIQGLNITNLLIGLIGFYLIINSMWRGIKAIFSE